LAVYDRIDLSSFELSFLTVALVNSKDTFVGKWHEHDRSTFRRK